MVSRNDITGDAIINTPKRGPREGTKTTFKIDMPMFEIMYCSRCHIKVSTHNKKCPCCGEELPNG